MKIFFEAAIGAGKSSFINNLAAKFKDCEKVSTECLPSTLCPHLLPLVKDQSGFYQVLGAPLINPDGGKLIRKSLTNYIRYVELKKIVQIKILF